MPWAAIQGEVPLVRTQASETASEAAFALLDALWPGPVGLAVLDRELRFVQVNGRFARATGLPQAEHCGRTPRELFGDRPPPVPAAIARAEERMRRVIETGRHVAASLAPWIRGDRRRREWVCSYHPVVGPAREVRGVCAVAIDATADRERGDAVERARMRAELSAARLALLHDLTAALSATQDASGVGEIVAGRLADALGAATAELRRLEQGRLRLVSDYGRAAHRSADLPLEADLPVCRAAREGRSLWLETPAAIRDAFPAADLAGAQEGGAAVAVPLVIREGIAGVVALGFAEARSFDLEERALVLAVAEGCAQALERAALLERERAAREDAERMRALLDAVVENAPVGLAFVDRGLRFVHVNPVLAEMNGLPREAHLGRTPRQILPGVPFDEVERAWREVLETGRPALDIEVSGETPAAPGKRRAWLQSWYPVRAGGEILGVGAVVREVTAERDADEFRRNVLGIVGHDLRSPLSALVMSARTLVASQQLSPEGARLAARIFSNAGRMERIISVLLDYARLRAGQELPLRRGRCDLAKLVDSVADECEASHPGRTVARRGEGEGTGEWDADRLAQALANLVGNALDYSPQGTPVEIAWRGEPGAVEIAVSNRGDPIPPDVLPRIFEPFRRAERERPGGRDGLGLGLFIARAIAAAHGGSLEAASSEEATVFTLRLPRGAP